MQIAIRVTVDIVQLGETQPSSVPKRVKTRLRTPAAAMVCPIWALFELTAGS